MAAPPVVRAAESSTGLPPQLSAADSGLPSDGDGAPISKASRRLRALATLSGSLTDPLTPEEAADLVERQALAVLGASSAVLVTLAQQAPNGSGDTPTPAPAGALAPDRGSESLTLVHATGLPSDV